MATINSKVKKYLIDEGTSTEKLEGLIKHLKEEDAQELLGIVRKMLKKRRSQLK